MSEYEDAWTDIPAGAIAGGRTERRADPNHPLDFYRGRDSFGRYLFVLKGNEIPDLEPLPSLAGIVLKLVHPNEAPTELVMELIDSEQVSIFRALVEDFLRSTADVSQGDVASGARRVIKRIARWQALLKRRSEGILSQKKVIGLVGELLFLRNRLFDHMSVEDALASWRGPHSDEQDFAIGEIIVEIKTQLSTADQYLMISSEAQLDTTSGPIILCHQTISLSIDGESNAETLNELVENIRDKCSNSKSIALDMLEAGLIEVGYETRAEYDAEAWLPVNLRPFEVKDGFPRLVPESLPSGVLKVSYRILPASCEAFERNEAWMKEVLFGKD